MMPFFFLLIFGGIYGIVNCYVPSNADYRSPKCSYQGKYISAPPQSLYLKLQQANDKIVSLPLTNTDDPEEPFIPYCECADGFVGETCEVDDTTRRLFQISWQESGWSYLIYCIFFSVIIFIGGSFVSWGDVKFRLLATQLHSFFRRFLNPLLITAGILEALYFLAIMNKMHLDEQLFENEPKLGPSRKIIYWVYIICQLEPLIVYFIMHDLIDAMVCCKNDVGFLRCCRMDKDIDPVVFNSLMNDYDSLKKGEKPTRCHPPSIGFYSTKRTLYSFGTLLTSLIVDFAFYDYLFSPFDFNTYSPDRYWAIISCGVYWSKVFFLMILFIPSTVLMLIFLNLVKDINVPLIEYRLATNNKLTQISRESQIMLTTFYYDKKSLTNEIFKNISAKGSIPNEILDLSKEQISVSAAPQMKPNYDFATEAPKIEDNQVVSMISRMQKQFLRGVMARSPTHSLSTNAINKPAVNYNNAEINPIEI